MAFDGIRKQLAFIQLADSKGDIYQPTSGKKGLVHQIILHNTNTAEESIILYLHDGVNEYKLWKIPLPVDETVVLDFVGEGLVVKNGAKLTGYTTTAAKVTCYVSGTEETE